MTEEEKKKPQEQTLQKKSSEQAMKENFPKKPAPEPQKPEKKK